MTGEKLRGLGPMCREIGRDVGKEIIAISIVSAFGTIFGLAWGWIHRWNTQLILGVVGLTILQVPACILIVRYAMKAAREKERARLTEEHNKELERLAAEAQKERDDLKRQHAEEITRILDEAEARLRAELRKLSVEFNHCSQEVHWFMHAARDLAVKMMAGVKPVATSRKGPIVPADYLPYLEVMLRRMAAAFQIIAGPDVKVFTAIRERRGHEYHTLLRAGRVDNQARQATTKPMRSRMKMVALLYDQFHKGDCVLLTGSEEPNWEGLPNDSRGEDKSVLMGAAFSKQPNLETGRFVPVRLEWIVCVAADKKGVFKELDKPLMKSFNDIFGLLMNIFLRQPLHTGGK